MHAMAIHLGIEKISFTGSTETGKLIMEAASEGLKAGALELEGKSATII
jgi:acyl-CoA reductase-like NAD-dependent aldehyde dehydrogenase